MSVKSKLPGFRLTKVLLSDVVYTFRNDKLLRTKRLNAEKTCVCGRRHRNPKYCSRPCKNQQQSKRAR